MNNTNLTKFSFGSTSAIVTSLALIVGLDTAINAKLGIIGSLLVIAIADNISDTLGIHIYQESEGKKPLKVWTSTFTNFLTRLLITSGFIYLIVAFPLNIAVILSIIYGLSVLSLMSFLIAKNRGANPWISIAEHLVIAVATIIISKLLGSTILNVLRTI